MLEVLGKLDQAEEILSGAKQDNSVQENSTLNNNEIERFNQDEALQYAASLNPADTLNFDAVLENNTSRSNLLSQEDLVQKSAQLMNAMHGFFNDKDAIIDALSDLTPEQSKQLEDFYKEQYDKSLESHLRSELWPGDLTRALNLLRGTDIERRVSDLHDAMHGLGTDEDKVFASLENLTKNEIAELRERFQDKYGEDLVDDWIRKELSGEDLEKALRLSNEIDHKLIAKSIFAAMGPLSTDEARVYENMQFLSNFDELDLKLVATEFENKYGDNLFQRMQSHMSGPEYAHAIGLLDPDTIEAGQLYSYMKGFGTNEAAVKESLTGLNSEQLRNVEANFEKYFSGPWGQHATLRTVLRDELGNRDLEVTLAALNRERDLLAEANLEQNQTINAETKSKLVSIEPKPNQQVSLGEVAVGTLTTISLQELDVHPERIKNLELRAIVSDFVDTLSDPSKLSHLKSRVASYPEAKREEFLEIASKWRPGNEAQFGFQASILTLLNTPEAIKLDNYVPKPMPAEKFKAFLAKHERDKLTHSLPA